MRRGTTACAALVAALAFAAPAAAYPPDNGRAAHTVLKTVKVDTRFEEPALRPDGFDCRPSLLAPATFSEACKMHLLGVSFLTGTLGGVADLRYRAWWQPPKLRFDGAVPFRGTVKGCGEGTFIMEFKDGIVHFDRFRASDQSVPGSNAWVVRRGSGTGGLEHLVSGGGDVDFRAYPLRGQDGTREFAKGEFTGSVTCARPSSRRIGKRRR